MHTYNYNNGFSRRKFKIPILHYKKGENLLQKKKSERERKKITTPTLEGLVHTTNRTWLKMVIISTLFNM